MLADGADGVARRAAHGIYANAPVRRSASRQPFGRPSPAATLATFVSDLWNDQLVAHDKQWLFLVLVGLVGSFAFIRLSTRLMRSPRVPWWPESIVSDSDVHLHHLVFGIVTMMVAGTLSFAGFATSPLYEICAFLLGVGIGLTIDEFVLWVHLDDVYWAREGRSSVDAAAISAGVLGLILLGSGPSRSASSSPRSRPRSSSPDRHLPRQATPHAWRSASSSSRWPPTAPRASASRARQGRGASTARQPPQAGQGAAALCSRTANRPPQGVAPGRRRRGEVTETEYEAKLARRDTNAAREAAALEAAEEVRRRAEKVRAEPSNAPPRMRSPTPGRTRSSLGPAGMRSAGAREPPPLPGGPRGMKLWLAPDPSRLARPIAPQSGARGRRRLGVLEPRPGSGHRVHRLAKMLEAGLALDRPQHAQRAGDAPRGRRSRTRSPAADSLSPKPAS